MSRPTIVSIIGARPEIIQAARVTAALAPLADEILVHTGQHYDEAMSGDQIADTRLPQPAVQPRRRLARPRRAGRARPPSGSLEVIEAERPDAVIVRGDTNATLSGARAAVAAGVPLMHVEAGLRSLPRRHARGAQPHRDRRARGRLLRPDRGRPAQPAARGRRRRSSTSRATRSATCSSPGATGSSRPRATTCWRRSTATTTPTIPSAWRPCWSASAARPGGSCSPSTRAPARRSSRASTVPANVELVEPVPYTADARARARRPGDRHRLRRRPARGVPVGRPVRDAARGDRVGRHRRGGLEHARRRRPRPLRRGAAHAAAGRASAGLRRRPRRRADRGADRGIASRVLSEVAA